MIDASCPYCNQYIQLEYKKLGSFQVCPFCDEKFKVIASMGSAIVTDADYEIEYKKFMDIMVEELEFLNTILKEQFKICISYRWKDNDLLQYYAFKLYHPEIRYELYEIFNMINNDKRVRNNIYNKWMDNHR